MLRGRWRVIDSKAHELSSLHAHGRQVHCARPLACGWRGVHDANRR